MSRAEFDPADSQPLHQYAGNRTEAQASTSASQMLLRLFRQPSLRTLRRAYPLAKAARLALEKARHEQRPLAYIAQRENAGNEVFWFAKNYLRIVPVYGRRNDTSAYEPILREQLASLTLANDMSRFKVGETDETGFVDLRVTRSDHKKYIRWVRSVW